MQATIEQLSQIIILAGLEKQDRINLQPHTKVQRYSKGEIVLHEGDRLPAKLIVTVRDALLKVI
uniref:hypothetical protein n=1 Tax=Hassallia byssoidea TaxID=482630 RepID=UPI000584E3AC